MDEKKKKRKLNMQYNTLHFDVYAWKVKTIKMVDEKI